MVGLHALHTVQALLGVRKECRTVGVAINVWLFAKVLMCGAINMPGVSSFRSDLGHSVVNAGQVKLDWITGRLLTADQCDMRASIEL